MTLSEQTKADRYGRFTASEVWKLFAAGRGNEPSKVRESYVREVAESKLTKWRRSISSWQMDHGNANEFEAIEQFRKRSGLLVEFSEQRFVPFGNDAGATPDGYVVNFDGKTVATVDVKCPVSKFFEQKYQILTDAKPEYQMTPVQYYWQAQLQMMAISSRLGYPVDRHYLVRWFTTGEVDENGDEIQTELPDKLRMFWKIIEAHPGDQKRLIEAIEQAAMDRDFYFNMLSRTT